MGVKKFWGDRSYFQKGFIIGVLLYFGFMVFSLITSFVTIGIVVSEFIVFLVIILIIIPLIFGLLFGFISFLIGLTVKGLWEDFFKPNKKKIQITLILFGILAFLAFLTYILHPDIPGCIVVVPFYLAMMIFYNLSIPFLIFLILFAYIFGCYISRSENWLKGIIFYLAAFMLVSAPLIFAFWAYDESLVNRDCNTDYDCYDTCEKGAVSKQSRHLSDPFQTCNLTLAVCKNNMWCETYLEYEVSESYCEEREDLVKSVCYHDLAKRSDDLTFCDNIENESWKGKCYNIQTSEKVCEKLKDEHSIANCYFDFAEYSNAHNVCNKIKDSVIEIDCKAQFNILSEEECEEMQESSYCYYQLAIYLKKPSLCEKIEDECSSLKEPCWRRFNGKIPSTELTQEELEEAKAIGLTEDEAKTAKSLNITPEEFNKTYTKAYEAFFGGTQRELNRSQTSRSIGYSRVNFEELKRYYDIEELGIKPCSKVIRVEYALMQPTPSMIVLIENGEVKVLMENLHPSDIYI